MIGALKTLLKTLSPNIDITLGDDIDIDDLEDCEVTIRNEREPDTKAVLGSEEVVLYPETFDAAEYNQYQTLVGRYKREKGRIATTNAHRETEAIESVVTDEVEAVSDFFDGVVSDRHHEIIKKSQYLRTLADQRDGEIDLYRAKGDLADRYGYEAYYIANLVSSGYFDQGRFFRELYRDVQSDGDQETEPHYREQFDLIIGEKLVATFVSADDSTHEVGTDIKSGMMKQFRHRPPVDFFDVCGLGEDCSRMIDTAVASLTEQYPNLRTDTMDRGEERVERLYPDSVQDFGIV